MNTLQLLEQDLLTHQNSSPDTEPLESTTDMQIESSFSSKNSPPSTSNPPTKDHAKNLAKPSEAQQDLINQEVTQATELNDQQQQMAEEKPQEDPLEMSAPLAQWDQEASGKTMELETMHNEAPPQEKQVEKANSKGQEEDVMECEPEKPKETKEIREETISAEDMKRIQDLTVSEATKKLIIEKYYRGPGHSDVKRFKEFERKPTALLYELFSMLYREKPVFDVDPPVVIVKGSNQYTAHHVFNKEKLTSGIGSSKQTAKGAASLKSLQIFAPSLAARCQQNESEAENEAHKPTIVIAPSQNNVVEEEKPLEKVVEKALKKTIEKTPEISMEEAIEKAVEKVLGKPLEKPLTPAKKTVEKIAAEVEKTIETPGKKTVEKVPAEVEKTMEAILTEVEKISVEIERNTEPVSSVNNKSNISQNETKENKGLLGEMEDLLDQQFDIEIEIEEEKVQQQQQEEESQQTTKTTMIIEERKTSIKEISLVDDNIEFFESLKALDKITPPRAAKNDEDNDLDEFEKMMMNPFLITTQEEQDPSPSYKLKKIDSGTFKKDALIKNIPSVHHTPKKPNEKSKAGPNEIKCDSINGLQINMSLPNTQNIDPNNNNILGEIKTQCREKGIKKLLEVLAEILKKDPKTRIDPKAAFNPEIGKALKFYCSHTLFTKLYMLHCLIHNKEADASLQINVIYYESECFVYLYSTELEQTFMFKSNSVVFSVEMAKYFLIYELYSKCFTVAELIDAMKVKMDKVKENTDDLTFKPTFNLSPQKQSETVTSSPAFNSPFEKERPTYQPTYRSQNYSKPAFESYGPSQSSIANNNSKSRSTLINESEYKNKENRMGFSNSNQQKRNSMEEDDDEIEIIEPVVAKKMGLRDLNTRQQREKVSQGKTKQVLNDMTSDLDSMFDDGYTKRIMPERRPPKKSASRSTVKDQMLDDIDNI